MGTNTQFKVTNYPSLEMQLQAKKPNNLGAAVGYLSGEAWKAHHSVIKARDHQKDGEENSGDISSLPESGGKFRSVWLSKVSRVTK